METASDARQEGMCDSDYIIMNLGDILNELKSQRVILEKYLDHLRGPEMVTSETGMIEQKKDGIKTDFNSVARAQIEAIRRQVNLLRSQNNRFGSFISIDDKTDFGPGEKED